MAAELVEEEAEHVNLVHRLLTPLSDAERVLGRRYGSAGITGMTAPAHTQPLRHTPKCANQLTLLRRSTTRTALP